MDPLLGPTPISGACPVYLMPSLSHAQFISCPVYLSPGPYAAVMPLQEPGGPCRRNPWAL